MSQTENLRTFENFVENGWRSSHIDRRVEEIVSTFKETNRLIDGWPYFVDQNGIYVNVKNEDDGKNKIYVKNLIAKEGYPENAEAIVFEKLEKWSREVTEGTAFWISPSYPNKYPCSKIIIHTVAYEFGSLQKTVLNSTILFDSDESQILNVLHKIFPETSHFKNLEEFRKELLLNNNVDISQIFSAIAKLDINVAGAKMELTEDELNYRAKYVAGLIENGENARFVAYEAQRLGLIGKFSISCPSANKKVGFSELGSHFGIEDRYGSLQFSCHKCGGTNIRPFGQLINNCQHCGANVRC